jgi:hypothetical protein
MDIGASSPVPTVCFRLCWADAVFGDFDFADAFEGKYQMDEIGGRIGGGLADDVANRVGDGGVKKHSSRLHPREIDAHELAFLEHENILNSSWAFCNLGLLSGSV